MASLNEKKRAVRRNRKKKMKKKKSYDSFSPFFGVVGLLDGRVGPGGLLS